jgi:hypothetical protein
MNAQDYRFQGDDSEEPTLKEFIKYTLEYKKIIFAIKTYLQIVFYILLILILIL